MFFFHILVDVVVLVEVDVVVVAEVTVVVVVVSAKNETIYFAHMF